MSARGKRVLGYSLAAGAVCLVAVSVALGALVASAAARSAPHEQHCGLFRSSVKWSDAEYIKGYFYSYNVVRLQCHSKHSVAASDPSVIAVLALHGHRHPYGFDCHVTPVLEGGYCSKGSPSKPATVKGVSWAPEVDCAIPDPPYTPAKLPAKCHT
jgi:hypothetical protein